MKFCKNNENTKKTKDQAPPIFKEQISQTKHLPHENVITKKPEMIMIGLAEPIYSEENILNIYDFQSNENGGDNDKDFVKVRNIVISKTSNINENDFKNDKFNFDNLKLDSALVNIEMNKEKEKINFVETTQSSFQDSDDILQKTSFETGNPPSLIDNEARKVFGFQKAEDLISSQIASKKILNSDKNELNSINETLIENQELKKNEKKVEKPDRSNNVSNKKLYELNVIGREQSLIYCLVDLNDKDFKEYVMKKISDSLNFKNEVLINKEIKKFQSKENNKHILFMETYYENEKSIIFQKGICDLEEFFNFFPEPDEEMLILIIDSILRSINFIHNTVGIPHFDIKLKNFLFCLENSSFVLKLIDFGNIIPLDKNKYEEMKKNDFFKLNKLLSTISEKSSKKSFSDWKITIPNIQTIQDEASFKELYQEFKTLEIKEDIYKLLYQKYFQRNEVEISFKTMNSNVSDEDKITLSDNLCLMGVFTKSLILILQIELDFFKKNLKYYIRVIQNKMILLVTFYYPKFLELKCRSLDLEPQLNFSENFKKLLELIEITYKENFDFLNKKIRSSDKIFGKFHSLLKELQILRDYLKNVTISENKGILEQIKVVQEKNKNKIKTKNEFSRRHIEIYHNFWEFLEISISCPEDHKLLEESWLNNFKNLVKKYIVVYNVDM